MALATGVCVGMAVSRASSRASPPSSPPRTLLPDASSRTSPPSSPPRTLLPDRRKRRLVGVLGGLGPEASALLLKLIVDEGARAGAVHDHEHPSVIVYVKPELPNSRLCVMGMGPSPVDGMTSALRMLQKAGATECCCACVTAHNFFREAAKTAGTPLLDLLDVTATRAIAILADSDRKVRTKPLRVGLLSTDATVKSQLFQQAIAAAALEYSEDVEVVVPKDISIVQSCILSIKAGCAREDDVGKKLCAEASKLVEEGALLIITGCTELPLGFSQVTHPEFPVPVLDPLRLLAKEIVLRHNESHVGV